MDRLNFRDVQLRQARQSRTERTHHYNQSSNQSSWKCTARNENLPAPSCLLVHGIYVDQRRTVLILIHLEIQLSTSQSALSHTPPPLLATGLTHLLNRFAGIGHVDTVTAL